MKKLLLSFFILCSFFLQGQNEIKSSVNEFYNGSSWDIFGGTNYEYDANNNLATQIEYNWNGSSYVRAYKESYMYNSNNRVTLYLDQDWDDTTNQYENSYRTIYTYASNGDLTDILDELWDGSQWVNEYKSEIIYTNGNPFQGVFLEWDGSQWVNDTRSTFSYTGSTLNNIVNEEWDGSQWVLKDRDVLTYNGNGQVITYTYEVWNGTSYDQEDISQYEYDGNGNRTRITETFEGGNQYKTEYSYDLTALLSNFANPFKDKTGFDYLFEGFPYVNKILDQTDFDFDTTTSTYSQSNRTTFDYNNAIVLSTKKVEVENLKIHPNPATDFLEITGLTKDENISIYSVLGNSVLKKIINLNQKIDIRSLSKGTYFLRFEDGRAVKFLKD